MGERKTTLTTNNQEHQQPQPQHQRHGSLWSVLESPTLGTETSHGSSSSSSSSVHSGLQADATPLIAYATPLRADEQTEQTSSTTSTESLLAPTSLSSSSPPRSPWQPRSIQELIRRDLPSTDAAVVRGALQQITLDCWDCPVARSAVARAGGILAVLSAMERHASTAALQVAACQALSKLALDADNATAIAELGGVDTILGALMTHFEHPTVQEAAWAALQNCTSTAGAALSSLDTTPGALQVLVQAYRQHAPRSATTAGHAAATMANVSVSSVPRTNQIVRANGIVLMAETLQHYWDSDPQAAANVAHSLQRLCGAIHGRGSRSSTGHA